MNDIQKELIGPILKKVGFWYWSILISALIGLLGAKEEIVGALMIGIMIWLWLWAMTTISILIYLGFKKRKKVAEEMVVAGKALVDVGKAAGILSLGVGYLIIQAAIVFVVIVVIVAIIKWSFMIVF